MNASRRPTRRNFLVGTAGITAAAAIPAAAAPVHPDAALLAACAEFDDLELQYQAPLNNPYGEVGEQSIEWENVELERRAPLIDAQRPLRELIG